jgi:hypothetical protein
MAPMTAATTLLALLDHADADQLLVLLDAQNLLSVLEHHGRERETLKRELARGQSPGTLLLGLFEQGHSAAALISILPPGTLERVKSEGEAAKAANKGGFEKRAALTSQPRAPASSASRVQPSPARGPTSGPKVTVALVAYLVALTVPAMLVSGVLPLWTISLSTGIAIAGIGAGLAGLFAAHGWPMRIAGMVSGVLSAPGAVALTYLWLLLRGGTVLRIELALAVTIGALPGAILYGVCRAVYQRMSARAPQVP